MNIMEEIFESRRCTAFRERHQNLHNLCIHKYTMHRMH